MMITLWIAGYLFVGILIALVTALLDSAVTGDSCALAVFAWPFTLLVYAYAAMAKVFGPVCDWSQERRRKRVQRSAVDGQ